MKFSNSRDSTNEWSVIQVDVIGAAAAFNPCYRGASDIDYKGTITIDVQNRFVSLMDL
jgi:hypothetical protein